jgi:hypothetical protein
LFSPVCHFHPSLIFAGKAGAKPCGALTWLHSKGRVLALTPNIWLGWKWLTVTKHSNLFYNRMNNSYKMLRLLALYTLNYKHSSLFPNRINYSCKKFYSTDLWPPQFHSKISTFSKLSYFQFLTVKVSATWSDIEIYFNGVFQYCEY